jgi:hypothetical protein
LNYNYDTTKLLTVNKNSDYLIATLYLSAQKNIMNAPYYGIEYDKSLIDISKVNLCKKATNGCATSCLYHQGILKNSDFAKNKIKIARIKRTFKFLLQRDEFFAQLIKEITALQKKALKEGLTLAVQLNGTSDVLWEKEEFTFKEVAYENLMSYFNGIQFFDYTKYDILKSRKKVPNNYHLTYSRAGLHKGKLIDDWKFLQNLLDKEIDVSVIFNKKMKNAMLEHSNFLGYKLIDADLSNCRIADIHHRENNKGLILVHEAAKKTDFNNSGFIIQSQEELNKYFSLSN